MTRFESTFKLLCFTALYFLSKDLQTPPQRSVSCAARTHHCSDYQWRTALWSSLRESGLYFAGGLGACHCNSLNLAPHWVPGRVWDCILDLPSGLLHWHVGCLHKIAPTHRTLDRAKNGHHKAHCKWNSWDKNEHVGMALQEQSRRDTQVKAIFQF